MIYLDYAAATPVADYTLAAMQPYFKDKFYNPSGLSLRSRQVRDELNGFRQVCARVLNTSHSNVVFTAGATEANNLALHGVAARNPGSHMLVASTEHDAILNVMPWLAKWFDITYETVPVGLNGIVDREVLRTMLTPKTSLVSIMHTNNETGVVQPLSKIKSIIEDESPDAILHTDASQAALTTALHFDRNSADMVTLNGGKMYGPKQSGVLVSNKLKNIDPLIIGGGQEKGLRAGTESLVQIAGVTAAFTRAQQNSTQEHERLQLLQSHFEMKLQDLKATVHGDSADRSPSITSVCFPDHDAEILLFKLEEQGIIAASGSACSAGSHATSHVLEAMGVSKADSLSTLRFSYGTDTTSGELDKVIEVLSGLISKDT